MKIKSPKKLIEVNLPLKEINEAAAREKSIRHGHPSTLHLYWARRPLAAARAVIFAQMVNDPGGERGWAKGLTKEEAAAKRERLFDIIRDLVKWENTNNEEVLERARAAIRDSWRETCALNKGVPGFDPEKLPAFHDPFAGGGAIPLEAQRLGLEAYASDLNPVAVMINKAMIEIPPRFAGFQPIGPIPAGEAAPTVEYSGIAGIAEDVRRYGSWMRARAQDKIGNLYPPVAISASMAINRPDLKQYVGRKLNVIAWIWARTVKSPNPQFSHVWVPLVSSFVLSSKQGKEAYIEPIVDKDHYRFEVKMGKPPSSARSGTKPEGSSFKCLVSETNIDIKYIREEARSGRVGCSLMAIVCEGDHGRVYLSPVEEQLDVANRVTPSWSPNSEFCPDALGFRVGNYGMTKWSDLYTKRQLEALSVLSALVAEMRNKIIADGHDAGIQDDGVTFEQGGSQLTAYADAVAVYLSFAIDKTSNRSSTLCTFKSGVQCPGDAFGRQAIPMTWDFAESNVITGPSGSFESMYENVVAGMMSSETQKNFVGFSQQADAQTQQISINKVVSTDPPYYDNIGYADLSDYFYVWMRRCLKELFPITLSSMLTPKDDELVATPCRHGGNDSAATFFLTGMEKTFSNIGAQMHPAFPLSIYYAFKSSSTDSTGTGNKGWETFLEALVNSGLVVTGTWPVATERGNRKRAQESNALDSSIVLVCRKRPEDAATISRSAFIKELRAEMHEALMDMTNGDAEHAAIAPVDLQQAAIGPGMGVYSKYREIQKMDGSRLTVHEAMLEIMKEIDAFLNPDTALKDVDSSTRFFVEWFKIHGFDDGPFGEAQTLATAKNTTVAHVVGSGVAMSSGGKVRILNWEEYPDDPGYDPCEDDNLPLWEACHRVIRELKQGSARSASTLLAKMPASFAGGIYHLAYYLHDFCTKQGDAANARVYNELATSWEDVLRIKDEILMETEPKKVQGMLGI